MIDNVLFIIVSSLAALLCAIFFIFFNYITLCTICHYTCGIKLENLSNLISDCDDSSQNLILLGLYKVNNVVSVSL